MSDISYTDADTALCLMMEHVEMEMTEAGQSPLAPYVEFNGTMSLRNHLVDYVAPLFNKLWEKHTENEEQAWSFDFEFVPRLLMELEFDELGYVDEEDASYITKKLVEQLNKEFA